MKHRLSPSPEHFAEKYRRLGIPERNVPAFCRMKCNEVMMMLRDRAKSHRKIKYTPRNFPVGVKRIFCNGVDRTDFAFEADFRKGHVKVFRNDGRKLLPDDDGGLIVLTYHGKLELRDA